MSVLVRERRRGRRRDEEFWEEEEAGPPPPPPHVAAALRLQRAAGNAAVSALIQRRQRSPSLRGGTDAVSRSRARSSWTIPVAPAELFLPLREAGALRHYWIGDIRSTARRRLSSRAFQKLRLSAKASL